MKDFICTMPLRVPEEGWNYIQLNLRDLCRRVYGSGFKSATRLTIHANCSLRRVFFSDSALSEEQLPAEMRLYAPPRTNRQ